MKKCLALALTSILAFSLTACSDKKDGATIVSSEPESAIETMQPEKPKEPEKTEEPEKMETTTVQDIDYAPYAALVNAYTLDYNVEYTGAEAYVDIGMALNPTTYGASETAVDASGFCYANLVDLDANGVLELILVAYDEQEYADDDRYYEEYAIYVDELKYPNIVKVYTILPDDGLTFLGSLPLNVLQSPVGYHLGIEYSHANDKIYLVQSELCQMGDGVTQYYGLSDGYFGVEGFFEIEFVDNYVCYVEGEEVSQEIYDAAMSAFGEREQHPLVNLYGEYINRLETINKNTVDFLANYPVSNFESASGAYYNGQFYFDEYLLYDYFPANAVIKQYYKALTMRDYDTLTQLIGDEETEHFKIFHSGENSTYVPGYIISDMQQAVIENIENADMANDIASFVAQVDTDTKDTLVMKCIVNEVLDPHTTQLGLQVSGDLYETYFVVSSENPVDGNWKIEAIFDDKFYW